MSRHTIETLGVLLALTIVLPLLVREAWYLFTDDAED